MGRLKSSHNLFKVTEALHKLFIFYYHHWPLSLESLFAWYFGGWKNYLNSAVAWFLISTSCSFVASFGDKFIFSVIVLPINFSINELTRGFSFIQGVHVTAFSQVISSKKKAKLFRRTKKYLAAVSSHLCAAHQVFAWAYKEFFVHMSVIFGNYRKLSWVNLSSSKRSQSAEKV